MSKERDSSLIEENLKLKEEVEKLSKELRDTSQLLASIFEGLNEAVIIINGDYRIVYASKKAAELAAKPSERLLGGYCYNELHKLSMPCTFCSTVETIATKQPKYAFYKWRLPVDTSDHYIEHFSFPIKNSNGEVFYVMEHFRDVTERVRMFDKLISYDRLTKIGEKIPELVHEIKNPLNSIDIQMAILEREAMDLGKGTKEEVREIVEIVRKEIQRLSQLATDFLHHPDISSSLNRFPEELEPLLKELAALVKPQAAQQNIAINVDLKDALPEVWVDRNKFKQALLNLILNSIEAMPHGGIISLRSMKMDNKIRIFISDTGKGIPEEQWKQVFEMFYTTKSGSSGIGLPLSRNIVEAHGGALELISSPQGTTFLITLPLDSPRSVIGH